MNCVDVRVGECYIADAIYRQRLLNRSRDLPKSQSGLAVSPYKILCAIFRHLLRR